MLVLMLARLGVVDDEDVDEVVAGSDFVWLTGSTTNHGSLQRAFHITTAMTPISKPMMKPMMNWIIGLSNCTNEQHRFALS